MPYAVYEYSPELDFIDNAHTAAVYRLIPPLMWRHTIQEIERESEYLLVVSGYSPLIAEEFVTGMPCTKNARLLTLSTEPAMWIRDTTAHVDLLLSLGYDLLPEDPSDLSVFEEALP